MSLPERPAKIIKWNILYHDGSKEEYIVHGTVQEAEETVRGAGGLGIFKVEAQNSAWSALINMRNVSRIQLDIYDEPELPA